VTPTALRRIFVTVALETTSISTSRRPPLSRRYGGVGFPIACRRGSFFSRFFPVSHNRIEGARLVFLCGAHRFRRSSLTGSDIGALAPHGKLNWVSCFALALRVPSLRRQLDATVEISRCPCRRATVCSSIRWVESSTVPPTLSSLCHTPARSHRFPATHGLSHPAADMLRLSFTSLLLIVVTVGRGSRVAGRSADDDSYAQAERCASTARCCATNRSAMSGL
jgi:hypothetical protein